MNQFKRATGRGWLCAMALSFTVMVGCGPGQGDVSGTVSYKGRNLVYGSVMLIGSDGIPKYSEIKADGSYAFAELPVGDYRVGINSSDPLAPMGSRDGETKSSARSKEEEQQLAALKTKWVPLPLNYGDPKSSNLTLSIAGAKGKHDIELK